MVSYLTYINYTILVRLARDKNSRSLRKFVTYGHKWFLTLALGVGTIKFFPDVINSVL
jgi:hypothetical protein